MPFYFVFFHIFRIFVEKLWSLMHVFPAEKSVERRRRPPDPQWNIRRNADRRSPHFQNKSRRNPRTVA
jgi:hypothetical protein